MASNRNTPSARGKGRCLGLAVLWAELAYHPAFTTGSEHVCAAMSRNIDTYFPWDERTEARNRHSQEAAFQDFLSLEAPTHSPADPDEPMKL